ncbi:MAG: YraN family protein [Ruminococcaceae bacterium]|nr:YraN family protein [Oscillospiraceae bacterium]
MNAKNIGMAGEKAACKFLKKNGYKILELNYQRAVGKIVGEIDIIARKGDVVSFVEVKTRQGAEFGLPCEAVTYGKQQRIIKTAYTYIAEHQLDLNYSFDIVEVYHDGKKVIQVHHIPYAFSL